VVSLSLDNFYDAEWIRRQWVEMLLKECASEIREARKTGRRGNKRLATDVGKFPSKMAQSNLPELPNTTFMVVISRVPNGKDMVLAPKHLQASISKKHFRPGGMAPSEWTRSVRAVRDTPVEDNSAPCANMTRHVAYRPPSAVSPFLLAPSVSCCK